MKSLYLHREFEKIVCLLDIVDLNVFYLNYDREERKCKKDSCNKSC